MSDSPTGGSSSYYKLIVTNPVSGKPPYETECLDIIEALGMSFCEGEAFKALWRSCAARNLNQKKPNVTALYDAEKIAFYGNRILVQQKLKVDK